MHMNRVGVVLLVNSVLKDLLVKIPVHLYLVQSFKSSELCFCFHLYNQYIFCQTYKTGATVIGSYISRPILKYSVITVLLNHFRVTHEISHL
jgi:hypothetical protein